MGLTEGKGVFSDKCHSEGDTRHGIFYTFAAKPFKDGNFICDYSGEVRKNGG